MDIVKLVNDLSTSAAMPRCFSIDELSELTNNYFNPSELKAALHESSRFICLQADSPKQDRFILDSTLFDFFSQLNVRLAQIQKFRLADRQAASAMTHLRANGRWNSPPVELTRWGQSLGLIQAGPADGIWVFPLAKIMSFLKPRSIELASKALSDFCEHLPWQSPLKKMVEDSLNLGFSLFTKRVAYVIKARQGFLTGRKIILQEIGDQLGCTREYARQLEDKFWKRIRWSPRYRSPFLKALLLDFFNESGSLVTSIGSYKAKLRTFLADCNFVPYTDLLKIGLRIIGATHNDFASLRLPNWSPDKLEAEDIANRMEQENQIALANMDVQAISERMSRYRKRHLTRAQMVYLALRKVGRPAHFSEVTYMHNSLWPDLAANEHSIHAVLSRQTDGIVWIGIHGTYALKDWGYERPKIKLYDAVVEIVRKKFEETRMPVPFMVISAEIGKYRKVTKSSSLLMSVHFNPRLRCVNNDFFVPKDPDEKTEDDVSLDELDKIFRDFQKKTQ